MDEGFGDRFVGLSRSTALLVGRGLLVDNLRERAELDPFVLVADVQRRDIGSDAVFDRLFIESPLRGNCRRTRVRS